MELSVDRNDCVAKFDGDDAFGINGLIDLDCKNLNFCSF